MIWINFSSFLFKAQPPAREEGGWGGGGVRKGGVTAEHEPQ